MSPDPALPSEPLSPTDEASAPPRVFLSYSHADDAWKKVLEKELKALVHANRITLWDDRRIGAGEQWYDEIKQAMSEAAIAVCLISENYLASDFCAREEIPYLLDRRENHGMIILPVLLRHSAWQAFPWIRETQMLPGDGKDVVTDHQGQERRVFLEIALEILEIAKDPARRPSGAPALLWEPPEDVDIRRLPETGEVLVGRQDKLKLLDTAWTSSQIRVISLFAYGGVGKSNLVKRWLEALKKDNYRGARRVFGWSFQSRGQDERATSADRFMDKALSWYGDTESSEDSPWAKAERLADLMREKRTLLILDAIEPLQSQMQDGQIRDPAIETLLLELARENPGLCVVTTRIEVPELEDLDGATQVGLELLKPQAGRTVLRIGEVQGSEEELLATSVSFGNHALALDLLAAYLQGTPDNHVRHATGIPDLDIDDEEGKHSRRLLAAFEQRFTRDGDWAKLELLRALGLFNRPVEEPVVHALRRRADLTGLTEHLGGLSDGDWEHLLREMRWDHLLAPRNRERPQLLDSHPVLRAHFRDRLRSQHEASWREGNSRLYDYYRDAAEELPETLEEMVPLFHAVEHGCQAGRQLEALEEVYYPRIQRGGETNFCMSRLGAVSADTAALSNFFRLPWTEPVELPAEDRALLLNNAGYRLQKLGRLGEALAPMQLALEVHQESGAAKKDAAQIAGNISMLLSNLGRIPESVESGQLAATLADESGDVRARVGQKSHCADALHQLDRLEEAGRLFQEAEELQLEIRPEHPYLFSHRGFLYCDLLINQGRYGEVQRRANTTLEWARKEKMSLLAVALDHLSLGRAQAGEVEAGAGGDLVEAAEHLERAIEGLHRAGHRDYLPRGILARAAVHRLADEIDKGRRAVERALAIAQRGKMRRHEADCHLELARLALAAGQMAEAKRSRDNANELIIELSYKRRLGAAREIGQRLRS